MSEVPPTHSSRRPSQRSSRRGSKDIVDDNYIAPPSSQDVKDHLVKQNWLKISRTPYNSIKGGYGVVKSISDKTGISKDSPDFFQIKEITNPPTIEKNPWDYITKKPKLLPRKNPYESSVDTPSWFHMEHTNGGKRINKKCDHILSGHQLILGDPVTKNKNEVDNRSITEKIYGIRRSPYWTNDS